jgi:ubiquitin-like modifier-activating enzyme 5
VEIETFNVNITTLDNYNNFLDKIKTGGLDGGRVSIVLSCVDNY